MRFYVLFFRHSKAQIELPIFEDHKTQIELHTFQGFSVPFSDWSDTPLNSLTEHFLLCKTSCMLLLNTLLSQISVCKNYLAEYAGNINQLGTFIEINYPCINAPPFPNLVHLQIIIIIKSEFGKLEAWFKG